LSKFLSVKVLFIFSTPVLIRHLWQLKVVVFPHWCPILTVLFIILFIVTTSHHEIIFCMWFIFSALVLIRHLCQLKVVVFLHWHLINTVLLFMFQLLSMKSIFAASHSDINQLNSGLLHLTGQPNSQKGRSAKVKME
jgi:hypothetical protein